VSTRRVAVDTSVERHGSTAITGVRESTHHNGRRIIMPIRCRQEDRMRATRIMTNLRVADIEATKSFYTDYLGLSTEEFNMGWVARYTSPDIGANVQLVTRDATAPEDSVISVATDDIDDAYEEAQRLGYEIVHPLTTEPWGVRRFFVRAPDGNVLNIVNHRD
jgi:predicted enzyme related to lactoylglutathione lyase